LTDFAFFDSPFLTRLPKGNAMPLKCLVLNVAGYLLAMASYCHAESPDKGSITLSFRTFDPEIAAAGRTYEKPNAIIVWLTKSGAKEKAVAGERMPVSHILTYDGDYDKKIICAQVGDVLSIKNDSKSTISFAMYTYNNKIFPILEGGTRDVPLSTLTTPSTVITMNTVNAKRISPCRLFVFNDGLYGESDKAGVCQIKDIPAGKYRVHVWNNDYGLVDDEFLRNKKYHNIKAGSNITEEIDIPNSVTRSRIGEEAGQ
jgi:hypothetical protein